jgi:phenylalanyl-tRNA synthetase beta chain
MGKKLIARYGKIHPVVLENFPKLSNTYGLEFFYENLPLETMYKKKLNNTFDSSFQFSEKDFSFIFEKNQNLFEVHRMLMGIDKKLIQNVEFFDEYNSSEIGDDFKSVTFKITLQSDEKTLTEENLENIHQNIIEKTSQKFNAKLRS